jgi:hypothetical protein
MSDGITHARGCGLISVMHRGMRQPYEATVAAICAHLVKESCESLAAPLGAPPASGTKQGEPLAALGTPKEAP